MPSIGGVPCTFLRANRKPLTERIEIFDVLGIDGHGVHLLGLGEGQFSGRAILYGSANEVSASYEAIASMVGQPVVIENDWLDVHGDILLAGVGLLAKGIAVGEGGCRGEFSVSLVSLS